ncbi:MAG: 4a-hydroxytetrahydrobiopterin dehydratase [Gemmatimonadales bacterium]|jgi:4a-hydroxytetrahydrobiopterin dehydratase
MAKLTDTEIAQRLKALPTWAREGNAIRRSFSFGKFADGIRFVDRVAMAADAMGHHPDIDIRHTTITMTLSTHSAGGLTARDFDLAAKIDVAAR